MNNLRLELNLPMENKHSDICPSEIEQKSFMSCFGLQAIRPEIGSEALVLPKTYVSPSYTISNQIYNRQYSISPGKLISASSPKYSFTDNLCALSLDHVNVLLSIDTSERLDDAYASVVFTPTPKIMFFRNILLKSASSPELEPRN